MHETVTRSRHSAVPRRVARLLLFGIVLSLALLAVPHFRLSRAWAQSACASGCTFAGTGSLTLKNYMTDASGHPTASVLTTVIAFSFGLSGVVDGGAPATGGTGNYATTFDAIAGGPLNGCTFPAFSNQFGVGGKLADGTLTLVFVEAGTNAVDATCNGQAIHATTFLNGSPLLFKVPAQDGAHIAPPSGPAQGAFISSNLDVTLHMSSGGAATASPSSVQVTDSQVRDAAGQDVTVFAQSDFAVVWLTTQNTGTSATDAQITCSAYDANGDTGGGTETRSIPSGTSTFSECHFRDDDWNLPYGVSAVNYQVTLTANGQSSSTSGSYIVLVGDSIQYEATLNGDVDTYNITDNGPIQFMLNASPEAGPQVLQSIQTVVSALQGLVSTASLSPDTIKVYITFDNSTDSCYATAVAYSGKTAVQQTGTNLILDGCPVPIIS